MRTTTQANLINLNNRCEFIFEGTNVWAPMGHCPVNQLGQMMNTLCGERVILSFRTSERHKESDLVRFARRLEAICGWEFGDWYVPIVNGHPITGRMDCQATRAAEAPAQIAARLRDELDAARRELSIQENRAKGWDPRKLVKLSDRISDLEYRLSQLEG